MHSAAQFVRKRLKICQKAAISKKEFNRKAAQKSCFKSSGSKWSTILLFCTKICQKATKATAIRKKGLDRKAAKKLFHHKISDFDTERSTSSTRSGHKPFLATAK